MLTLNNLTSELPNFRTTHPGKKSEFVIPNKGFFLYGINFFVFLTLMISKNIKHPEMHFFLSQFSLPKYYSISELSLWTCIPYYLPQKPLRKYKWC